MVKLGLVYEALAASRLFYMVKTDLAGNFTYANEFFLEEFSHTPEEFIGKSFSESIYKDDIDKCLNAAKKSLSQPKTPVEVQIRKYRKGIGLVWTAWDFTFVPETEEIICIGVDNNEKHALNKQLISNAKRTDRILESITDGFFTLNKDFEFTKTNKLFDELAGWKPNELLGKNFWEIYPEYKALYDKSPEAQRAFATGETFQFERFSERRKKWFSIKIYPSSEGIAVFFQDVTEKKAHIDEIVEKNSLLTEIAHIQSHQIRRPVATILGLVQLIDKGGLSQENKDLLEMLKRTALELDEVIHVIVDKASRVKRKSGE